MSTGAIIGIVIAVIVVAAIVVVASAQLRRARMRRQFGPEYDRLAKQIGPRKADAELTARQRRVDALDIHPLPAERQARYARAWAVIQEQFVDAPARAVTAADALIWDVMRDRGYPADDRKASIEALSVYHARSLEGYRTTQDLRTESASTEQLREALIRDRALFEDLTGLRAGQTQPRRADGAQIDGAAPIDGRVAETDRMAAGNGNRLAENNDRIAVNSDRVAENGDLAAQSRDLAAQNRDLAAQNRDLVAEDTDRTADTPR
jgi:hypothetical protein